MELLLLVASWLLLQIHFQYFSGSEISLYLFSTSVLMTVFHDADMQKDKARRSHTDSHLVFTGFISVRAVADSTTFLFVF